MNTHTACSGVSVHTYVRSPWDALRDRPKHLNLDTSQLSADTVGTNKFLTLRSHVVTICTTRLSIYLSGFLTAVAVFRKPNAIPLCFSIDLVLDFFVVMAVCNPSIHVFLGRPLLLLSRGIQSINNFGILSSGILSTWPYHCSLFCSMIPPG